MKKSLFILFLLLSISGYCQTDILKSDAIQEMKAGRYGEAIDLLNRYLSKNPQESEGYNLRGICYEKRNLYEMAVYDFRSARKLKPTDNNINLNLSRATDSWYKLLYNQIEGHKREIAINPLRIKNYLEIGKCYKNLGEWITAEEWYDKYLNMEEASSDEIIRYTEILAKNNHIGKGEPILKRYTEKYPDDHRLWSRYGYFTLWLGKNKIAIMAFEKALVLRPFFKEAMDGLDQAKGKGYIYIINDTSYTKAKGLKKQEYAIDKYYRQLKKEPSNNSIRESLINELLKTKRFEEALTQADILKKSSEGSKYSPLIEEVINARTNFINLKIIEYRERFNTNPKDYDAILNLAEYYCRINDFDSSGFFYSAYLENNSGNDKARLDYTKVLASNKDFPNAFDNIKLLRTKDPANSEFILLNSQLSVWTNSNLEEAKTDLQKILDKDSNNIGALVALTSACTQSKDFSKSEELLSKLQKLDPQNSEIAKLQDDLEFSKLRDEEEKLYMILEEGRTLAMNGNCSEALGKYEEYLSKASPNILIKKEYGDVQSCAKNYDKAISIYDEVLKEQYNIETDIDKAKVYYYKGDSVQALSNFTRLQKEKPDDFFVNLFLGDVYLQMRDFDNAKDTYGLLSKSIKDSTIEADTAQIAMLNLRYKWFPSSNGIFGNFGNNFSLNPFTQFYTDNQKFVFSQTGGRLDMSITNFMGIGVLFSRTYVNSGTDQNILNTLKGSVYIRIINNLIFSGSSGSVKSNNSFNRKVSDAILKYEKTDLFSLFGSYEFNDGRILLYSPKLIDKFYSAKILRFGGYYISSSGIKLNGYFNYLKVSDSNEGNQFQVRIGKKIENDIYLGYEYDYQNFAFTSKIYYSPKNLESHSIWGDWKIYKEQGLDLTIGGKIGYIPSLDFIVREIFGDVKFMPVNNFNLSGRVGFGSSFRDENSYNSFSASMSVYWSF